MKNWREKNVFEFLFYLNWRNFVPCLRTRLRDQIHRSSLPKMFLFLLVDFKFENGILKNRKRPQGHEIRKLWGWISDLQKESKFDYFHWNLIKKMEKKIQWDIGSQGLFGKGLSEVVHICLENWVFSKYKS